MVRQQKPNHRLYKIYVKAITLANTHEQGNINLMIPEEKKQRYKSSACTFFSTNNNDSYLYAFFLF